MINTMIVTTPIIQKVLGYFLLVLLPLCLMSNGTSAAWFESSGQAAIRDGNIEHARQVATQEAIRQALLFAGASVKSVQKMANGVLQNDDLEVRASGEVNSIELIDEVHSNGIISVSIRADIFSQQQTCKASDYQKSIVTAWQPLVNRMQAAPGGLFDIGSIIPQKLVKSFETYSQHSKIDSVQPLYVFDPLSSVSEQAVELAKMSGAQYVVLANIGDVSVTQPKISRWQPWKDYTPSRAFGYSVSLYDGFTGSQIWINHYQIEAPWQFDMYQQLDPNSQSFWNSTYGNEVQNVLHDVAQNIDEALACSPAYGRILGVNNEQLTLNIGKKQGMQVGDQLTLFQVQQVHDTRGNIHSRFHIHPISVTVREIYPNSSLAASSDGRLLANIQANDFVTRQ